MFMRSICVFAVATGSACGVAVAAPLIAADTFTRADSTDMGLTEFGGFAYQEFSGTGGQLINGNVARIQSGQAIFDGGAFGNDPALARLSGVGFNLDVSATVTMDASDYNTAWNTPGGRSNSPTIQLRQGMDFASLTTRGAIGLTIFPDATYSIRVTTQSGTFAGDANWQFTDLASLAPIGAPFFLTDADADSRLESNEPFTIRVVAVENQFSWYFNGVQIGPTHILPNAAVAGVDRVAASNFAFGRNRISSANSTELDVLWDNLVVETPVPGTIAPLIAAALFAGRRRHR